MKDQLSEIDQLEVFSSKNFEITQSKGKLKEMTEKNEMSYKQNLLLEDQKLAYMKQIESEQKKYSDLEVRFLGYTFD